MDWYHNNVVCRTWVTGPGGVATAVDINGPGSPVSGDPFPGNCSIGGVWYNGTDFPQAYRNTYFHAEFGANWIKSFTMDSADRLVGVGNFLTDGGGILAVATHPIDGGLYYLSMPTTLRRITYSVSGNLPPVARVSADRTFGPGPLTVQFTGSDSTDPEGLPLVYDWDFGDATPHSYTADPVHTFEAPAGVPTRHEVTLRVTDTLGQQSTEKRIISVNNTPPRVSIRQPVAGSRYPMSGDSIRELRADVTDTESQPSHGGAWA